MFELFARSGFKASKCKTMLRLALARIKLSRNKRDMELKMIRKEIANLLQTGQEATARIRVEHVYREQNMAAAYEIIGLFSELIIVRLPIIESQRNCPLDLKEAISSIIFAAPRCAEIEELLQVRSLFTQKYGKEFVASAAELRPDCGVNRRIIEKLSVRAPSGEVKLNLLKEIATEYNVEWDPSDSASELLKQHEDLLDGPSQFVSHSLKAPTPTMAEVPGISTPSLPEEDELPSVPVRSPAAAVPSVQPRPPSPTLPPVRPASPPTLPPPPTVRPASPPTPAPEPTTNVKQFIPFLSPPSSNSNPTPPPAETQQPTEMNYKDVIAAAQAAADSADRAATAARAAASLASTVSASKSHSNRHPAAQEESSDSEAEVTSTVRQQSEPNVWHRSEPNVRQQMIPEGSSDSDSDNDDDRKPLAKPQFDSEDDDSRDPKPPQFDAAEDDDNFWSRLTQNYESNNSVFNREPSTNSVFNREPSTKSVFNREPSTKYDEDTRTFYDRGTASFTMSEIPSYDSAATASDNLSPPVPHFDEPEPDLPAVPKRSSSIPPQRPPPDVPSPKSSLSPSGSGSFGHSAHPKLPDYDDLTSRFQALKSRR